MATSKGSQPARPAVPQVDPGELEPGIHVGRCQECGARVVKDSYFTATGRGVGAGRNIHHLRCTPKNINMLCSKAGNCLRCGETLDATVVSISVLSRQVRVHARCRDTFE